MKSRELILVIISLVVQAHCFGQNAIKHAKQPTQFVYTQLNLHGGFVYDGSGERWDISNHGPQNQLAIQLFAKNQKLLQKGYIKTISLSSYKLRFSIPFDINNLGIKRKSVSLKLLDAWVRFKTKWDRTSIWIGHKAIPYGHNPKLDPVSSFMTNITKMDLGLNQDLGIFLKTPISNKLDLELSLSSGGILNKSILTYENIVEEDFFQETKPLLNLSDFSYQNTWLVTSRIGTPTFKKNEYGIILTSGRLFQSVTGNHLAFVNRIGGDWVRKYYEKIKWSNQLTFGHTYSEDHGKFTSVHFQTGLDIYLKKRFFVSTSFASNYYNAIGEDSSQFNYITATSLTYSFSPHTRLRLNQYYSFSTTNDIQPWGTSLQFVTGIGKRP